MPPLDRIAAFHDELTRTRRDIHAHPELGFEEQRTADLVAERLAGFGVEVHRGIGKTGIVGRLRLGNSPRTIGLRADMDCLPIREANDFGHRSTDDGKMHACGHDGHTTMLLGAARYLAETRNFDGTVHFIFQPAEEGLGGAAAMVEDGLFERFPCEAIFGMHNRPGLAVGKFQIRPGAMMAGGAFFDIAVTGVGAHGARPEAGIDPVIAAAQIATAVQTIVARNVRPLDTAVVSVTQLHAGHAYVNHEDETRFIADCAAAVVGEANVNRNPNPVMASEDFAIMLKSAPGAYIQIGNGDGEGACEVHNPGYDFNDGALPYGAALFATLVERRLARVGAG